MSLLVNEAALFMTIQDRGRWGFHRFGLPESGPMDWWAFQGVNHLVGNTTARACVEIGFSSAEMIAEEESLMSLCGCGFRTYLNGREIPLWMAFLVRAGDRLTIEKVDGGNWAYLAVQGGIRSQSWMGSRSVNFRAELGQMIQKGDRLPIGSMESASRQRSGRSLPTASRPGYNLNPLVHVIPGPHVARFDAASLKLFWEQPYTVSSRSDRMGYRLIGGPLVHTQGADLVSQGMLSGEIQVPGDGQPIVMMPDHPTTGGYTCIGTVTKFDLPLLAQAQPGESQIRFQPIEVSSAQNRLAEVLKHLNSPIEGQEDIWHYL